MKKLKVNGKVIAIGSYTVEEVDEPSKYTVRVVRDDYPERPTDKFDTVEFYSNHRYIEGEDIESLPSTNIEELEKGDKGSIYRYVYMLDHSGMTVSTHPFNDPWDSGVCGICKVPSYGDKEWAEKEYKAFVKYFDVYLQGNIYGFQILNEVGEVVDSCGGFYGERKDIIESMMGYIDDSYGITQEDIDKAIDNIEY